MRIGYGFDAHRLAPHRKLVLGGVQIDYPLGLEGHSDADVLIHSIIDALLGAAGMGDIGMLFPDTDPSYEGVSSLRLLSETVSRITPLGFEISNVDVTLFAERPKIGPYREQIAQNVADAIGIHRSRINIKATTTEELGFVGRREGMAAAAVALLNETKNT